MLLSLLLLAAQGDLASEPVRPAELQDPAKKNWSGSADAGAALVSGNNESTTVSANAAITGTWGAWAVGANAGYTGVRTTDPVTDDARTTARIITYGANGKRFFDAENKLYAYVKAGDRKDEPNGLVDRWDAGAGAGYKFDLYTSAFLGLEAGASFVSEELVGLSEAEETGVFRGAYNFEAPFAKTWKAFGTGEYLNGGEVEAFTSLTGIKWVFREGWYFQASLQLFYDGTPAPGFDDTDEIFLLGIGLSF